MPQSRLLPIVVLRVARKINYAQIPDCCTFSNLIPVIAYEYRAKYYTFAFLRILVFLPKLFLNFKGLLWHELWYIAKKAQL